MRVVNAVTTGMEVTGFLCLVAAAFVAFGIAAGLAALGLALVLLGYLIGR